MKWNGCENPGNLKEFRAVSTIVIIGDEGIVKMGLNMLLKTDTTQTVVKA